MKAIRYITLLILVPFIMNSCTDDSLDVTSNSLTVENWYNTTEDFQMALNSAYCSWLASGLQGRQWPLHIGVWDDRTLFETTGRDRLTVDASSGEIESTFDELYMGVYRTSKVLEQLFLKGVDGIDGMTQEIYDQLVAETRALRATYYMYLVILFDRPFFYNEENIPQDLLQDMTNEEQIVFWDQVEKDLTDAIPDLLSKTELPEEEIGRITSGAARAILGKAMLFKYYYYHARFGNEGSTEARSDLEMARDMFRAVMTSGEYNLIQPMEPKTELDYVYALLSNSSFKDLPSENNLYKSENNDESVWEIQFSDNPMYQPSNPWLPGYFNSGSLQMQFFSPHETSYRNIEGHPAMYHVFETDGAPAPFDRDPRCKATFYFDGEVMDFDPASPYHVGINSGSNYKRIADARGIPGIPVGTVGVPVKKGYFPVYWDGDHAPFNDPTNKRMIRYADVLLMYAEVMYILGDDGTGLNALNQVRQRVDMPDVGALTVEAIQHERDVELAYEYHRWLDLVRWSFHPEWAIDWDQVEWGINPENSVNPFQVGKNEFMPIPLKEIDLSHGNLKQNPGW